MVCCVYPIQDTNIRKYYEIIKLFAVYTLYRILILGSIIKAYWMVCCVYPIQDTNTLKY